MGKYDSLKTTLYDFYKKNKSKGRGFIKDQFLKLGAPKRSLNRWLISLENNKSLERKIGSGRPAKIASKANIAKVKKTFQ